LLASLKQFASKLPFSGMTKNQKGRN